MIWKLINALLTVCSQFTSRLCLWGPAPNASASLPWVWRVNVKDTLHKCRAKCASSCTEYIVLMCRWGSEWQSCWGYCSEGMCQVIYFMWHGFIALVMHSQTKPQLRLRSFVVYTHTHTHTHTLSLALTHTLALSHTHTHAHAHTHSRSHTHCKHILWAYMMDLCVCPSMFVHGFHSHQADVMSCNPSSRWLNMLKWRGSAVIKLFNYPIFACSEHFTNHS